jgi:hypothetical protein
MPRKTRRPATRARSARVRLGDAEAQEQEAAAAWSAVALPAPRLGRARSLAESLRRRRTSREISARPLSVQMLSNLLWAACGVNRRKGPFGGRGITAASASNSQEIDLVVALERGTYRYDAEQHRLLPVVPRDVRMLAISRGQANVSMTAPVQLIYVVDINRLTAPRGFEEPGLHDPEVQKSYYYVDTGLIAGNVYLFAASQGLACWLHSCDRVGLTRALKLRVDQRVLFAQSVGWRTLRAREIESRK